MHKKGLPPLIVSILFIIIGVICLTLLNNHWSNQTISINSPVISKVKKDTQAIDLKTIIHDTEKNVMQIEGQNEHRTLTGSGFLYNEKGDIITNAHVIQDADVIYVKTANARVYQAAIVGIGEETDIAVIRVPQLAGKDFLSVEKESLAEIGDEVIALGSPHGFQNTVTLGIISGSDRNFSVDGFDYSNVYQISAQITHGNSGGPLINRNTGNVIGINSVGTEDGTIGFSIPINEVIDQAEQWSNETQNTQLDFSNTANFLNEMDSKQLKEDADYLIDYFFEGIMVRDYVNAYTLLGSSMQAEMSYANFRERYINIVELLDYSDLSNTITENNHAETVMEVTIEKKLQNQQETVTETFQYKFTIGLENDQLKILKITKS